MRCCALAVMGMAMFAVHAQNISLAISNIPTAAKRVIAVVDGSVSTPIRTSSVLAVPTSSITMSVAVPSGGPYRARVIAVRDGSVPAVLRTGVAQGISVTYTTAVNITLTDVTFAVDPSTPVSGLAGAAIPVTIDINDAGEFTEGSYAKVFTASTPFAIDLGGETFTTAVVQSSAMASTR